MLPYPAGAPLRAGRHPDKMFRLQSPARLSCGIFVGPAGAALKLLEKALGKKKEMDAEKITAALTKVEKEKSAVEKMTYGDLMKDGKLPGTGYKVPEEDEKPAEN